MSLCRVEWGIKGRPALPSGVGGQRSPGSLPGGWSGASGGGQLLPPGGFGGHAHLPQQSHHTRDSQESAEGQRSPCSQQANSWGVSRGCRGQMPQGSACLALVYFFQEASEVGRWCPSRVELGGQRSLGSPPGGWLGISGGGGQILPPGGFGGVTRTFHTGLSPPRVLGKRGRRSRSSWWLQRPPGKDGLSWRWRCSGVGGQRSGPSIAPVLFPRRSKVTLPLLQAIFSIGSGGRGSRGSAGQVEGREAPGASREFPQ